MLLLVVVMLLLLLLLLVVLLHATLGTDHTAGGHEVGIPPD